MCFYPFTAQYFNHIFLLQEKMMLFYINAICLSWEFWSTCARSMRRYICVMNSANAFHACVHKVCTGTSVIQRALCCPPVGKNYKTRIQNLIHIVQRCKTVTLAIIIQYEINTKKTIICPVFILSALRVAHCL